MRISSLDIPETVEALEAIKEDIPDGVQVEELMHGLKCWRNPSNHFFVMRLHRTADPRKRTQEYITEARAGMGTAEWMREHELVWEALNGRGVYVDEWSPEFHTSRSTLGWNPSLPVLRGWDFGLYPAVVFGQLMPHSRLFVLRELVGQDIGVERFSEEVARLSTEWFPEATFLEFVDPTGRYRLGGDERSYVQILANRPIRARKIIPGENAFVKRRNAVVEFLTSNIKSLPSILIDPSCEFVIGGFNGGYHYAYSKTGILKDRPEKNEFSHPHDALQYMCSKVKKVDLNAYARSSSVRLAEPRYGPGLNRPSQSATRAA